MPQSTQHRRALLSLLLALLAGSALLGLRAGSASAASPAVAVIKAGAVTSGYAAPDPRLDPTAVPSVIAVAGQPLSVAVSFFDLTGVTPASFTKDTLLSLSATSSTPTGAVCSSPPCRYPAALGITTVLVPKGVSTATLTTNLTRPSNNVLITVAVADAKVAKGVSPGTTTQPFDVLSTLQTFPASQGSAFRRGIGGDTECTEATPSAPVCAIAILPQGANSDVLLSLGACDSALGCRSGASVVQLLSYLASDAGTDLYQPGSPATLLVKCDKTLCGTGAIKAIPVTYSLAGNGVLTTAGACPAKNTALATGMCVDYVQSTRDGSGDTLFYLLFTKDARVSIG